MQPGRRRFAGGEEASALRVLVSGGLTRRGVDLVASHLVRGRRPRRRCERLRRGRGARSCASSDYELTTTTFRSLREGGGGAPPAGEPRTNHGGERTSTGGQNAASSARARSDGGGRARASREGGEVARALRQRRGLFRGGVLERRPGRRHVHARVRGSARGRRGRVADDVPWIVPPICLGGAVRGSVVVVTIGATSQGDEYCHSRLIRDSRFGRCLRLRIRNSIFSEGRIQHGAVSPPLRFFWLACLGWHDAKRAEKRSPTQSPRPSERVARPRS